MKGNFNQYLKNLVNPDMWETYKRVPFSILIHSGYRNYLRKVLGFPNFSSFSVYIEASCQFLTFIALPRI